MHSADSCFYDCIFEGKYIDYNECKKAGPKLSVIPGRLTKKLLSLDLGINKSFKCKIRNYSENWMPDGIHIVTKVEKMWHATYSEVCHRVKNA